MANGNCTSSVSGLHQLIESAIAQRKDESEQLENLCQQMINGKSLTVSSFEIKNVSEGSLELVIKSESAIVLNVWKLGLFAAAEKMNLDYMSITIVPNGISTEFHPTVFEKIAEYLSPLANAMQANEGNFMDHFVSLGPKTDEDLHEILTAVMTIQGDCTKQVLETWDILKLDSCNFLDTERLFFDNNERSTYKIKTKTLDFGVEFYSLKDFSMWSACINFALSKVNIMGYSVEECLGNWIQIRMNPEDLGEILDFLKPISPSSINCVSEFISDCSVFEVTFYDDVRTPYKSWLDLVGKVNPGRVDFYRLGSEREAEEFLFPLADLVEIIDICDAATDPSVELPRLPFSDMKQILSRKCSQLIVHNSTLSLEEAEHFVQFFHHLSKVCYLQMRPNEDEMDEFAVQVGEYEIKSISTLHGYMIIIGHQNKKIPYFT